MFIISTIAGWLLERGVSEKASGPVAWVIAISLAVAAVWGGWEILEGSIIEEHEVEERGKRAEQQLQRQEEAQARDDKREDRDRAAIDDLKEGANDAVRSDPEGAGAAVGPVSRSVHDRLREQRQAERDPPSD